MKIILTSCMIMLSSLLLTGCMTATNKNLNPNDPYESFNRKSFQFNENIDKHIFKPTAQLYSDIVWWPVRDGVSNFFSNLNELPTIANDLLQVNPRQAMSDSWRFALNSSFGILGVVDVAKYAGLPKHTQDFGLTLARWGIKKSPYLVIPFFGSSSVRDAIGMPVDFWAFTVYPHIKIRYRYPILALDAINFRASLLGAEDIVQQAALDPYVFFRDAYWQRRAALIRHNDETALEGKTPLGKRELSRDNQVAQMHHSDDDILAGIDTNDTH